LLPFILFVPSILFLKCFRSLSFSSFVRPAGAELPGLLDGTLLKYLFNGRIDFGLVADVPTVDGGSIEVCGILGEGGGGA
jgi:hypothetical protein